MQELILPVDRLSGYIKNIFDSEQLLQNIQVRGEVSNYGETNKNAYFVLKGTETQINCVYFAVDLRSFIPKNGDMCVVKGSCSYYKKGGKVSFNVTDMRPAGTGDSYTKFLQLKDRLEKEGLFDVRHKKELPYFVGKLGVVTSRSGAVIHDIIKIAAKKYKGIDILLFSVKVQGLNAENDIAEGISLMDRQNADVIIVARGGGSAEDLQAFNTEAVARAIYNCRTPVVSAVGHETDYTLCDMAADVRAATPSAAADIAVLDALSISEYIKNLSDKIYKNTIDIYNGCLNGVKNNYRAMGGTVYGILNSAIAGAKYRADSIRRLMEKRIADCENSSSNLIALIDAKNPLKLLKKGYSAVTDLNGRALTSAAALSKGQDINIILSDGKVKAEVKEIKTEYKYDI